MYCSLLLDNTCTKTYCLHSNVTYRSKQRTLLLQVSSSSQAFIKEFELFFLKVIKKFVYAFTIFARNFNLKKKYKIPEFDSNE